MFENRSVLAAPMEFSVYETTSISADHTAGGFVDSSVLVVSVPVPVTVVVKLLLRGRRGVASVQTAPVASQSVVMGK